MVRTLVKLCGIFFENAKIRLAQSMAYRLNFFLDSLISFLSYCISPLMQYLLFSQTRGFAGWNLEQIILFQGLILFHLGLCHTLFGTLHFHVMNLLRRGEFDRLLLRPFPAIGVILVSGFNPRSLGSIVAGAFVIVYSAVSMRLVLTPGMIALALTLILFGLLLYMGFEILYSAGVIILVNMGRLHDILWWITRFGHYPLEIFSRTVGIFLVTVIPMAVWVNFPARVLLGRGDVTIVYSLLASVAFFCLSLLVWRGALKRYASAGG